MKDSVKEKIAIGVAVVVFLALVVVAVHKTDKWYYERRVAAQAQAEANDRALAAKAKKEKQEKHDAAVLKFNTCVATQTTFDKQTAAVRAKSVRPVCPPVTE